MYVELHAHSCFSLLDGANWPETLVEHAAALGMPALALTDHDAVYGAARFVQAAKTQGIHPILGAELTLAGGHHLTLLVENETGWHNLCYLISRGRSQAPYGEPFLTLEELKGYTAGLVALSGCRKGALAAAIHLNDRGKTALTVARRYRDIFGQGQFFIELQRHFLPGEERLLSGLAAAASYLNLPVVATNNVHYATRDSHPLQDVLVCLRHQTTLQESHSLRRSNSEYYLKSPAQMAQLFADYPEAIHNTLVLAERCHFDLHYGPQNLPLFPAPPGLSSHAYLTQLCTQATVARYSEARAEVQERLHHELTLIERMDLSNYFLILWDIVRFARSKRILYQGCSAAAVSLVAYLLNITSIAPLVHDLVFEDGAVLTDMKLSFAATRSEEVIAYIYDHYGAAHTAMLCTFITFEAHSALHEVGKVLGLRGEALAQAAQLLEEGGEAAAAPVHQLLDLCQQIEGLPHRLGSHWESLVITGAPLIKQVATEPTPMSGRVVVQWDEKGIAAAGLVKLNISGSRNLSIMNDIVLLVEAMSGAPLDLERLTFDDPAVYEIISQADTAILFPIESTVQTKSLSQLRPRNLADLVKALSPTESGSTAAALARFLYQTTWLKRYHPIPFYTVLLNNQAMNFWSTANPTNEVTQNGIPILPLDIHVSDWLFTVEGIGIRLGFSWVKGLDKAIAHQIFAERSRRLFTDLADFCGRVPIHREVLENLILAGAMDRWGRDKRQMLWQIGFQRQEGAD